jgi:hypothetical protein
MPSSARERATDEVHGVFQQFRLREQAAADVVVADEIPPVQCILAAHVGGETRHRNGAIRPSELGGRVDVEYRTHGGHRSRGLPFDAP